jgi:uncharacterized membrane protein
MMLKYLISYIAMIIVMAALDFLWIGYLAKHLYQSGIGHLMADKPNLVAAAVFYLVFCAGLLWFAIIPNLLKPGFTAALVSAAVFGFCAYATYDLSNLATLKAWPLSLTLIDIAWGTFASVITVTIALNISKALS